MVFCCAEEYPNRRLFMRFPDIPIQSLQVKLKFSQVLGFEFDDFQFDCNKAVQGTIEKEQIEGEIPSSDLKGVLAADITEVASKLDEEVFQLLHQTLLEVIFRVIRGKVEEFNEITVFKDRRSSGMRFFQDDRMFRG